MTSSSGPPDRPPAPDGAPEPSEASQAPPSSNKSEDSASRDAAPVAAALVAEEGRLWRRLRRLRRRSDAGPAATPPAPAAGTRFSAAEIHENVARAAEEELRRPLGELFWSALASGLTIGFSFVAGAYLAQWVPASYRPFAVAVGYPLGFIFVVQARNQLFTENTLEPVIPFLERRDGKTLRALVRLWTIVLVGNAIGTIIFGWVTARSPVLEPRLHDVLVSTATAGTSGGFGLVLYRAIFGGWLIALMAWLVSSTHSAWTQVVYIWITTAPISAFGFRHSIAGAVEAFYLASAGMATWGHVVTQFFIPAVIGNLIGGIVLVALLNHGQVTSSRARWRRRSEDDLNPD